MKTLLPVLAYGVAQLGGLLPAQSASVSAVGQVAVCAWDAPNQMAFATACLSPGALVLPSHISATDPRGTGAFLDITEQDVSGAKTIRLAEHTATQGGSSFVISRTSNGCSNTAPGPHRLIVGFSNPSPLPLKGTVVMVFSLLKNTYSPWGRVTVDVLNDGFVEYDYTLGNSDPAFSSRREFPVTIPGNSMLSVLYTAELSAYFPANYSITTDLTFIPNKATSVASYGVSCGPVLQLVRGPMEHGEVAMQVSSFPSQSPWFLGIGVQKSDTPIGSGVCRLLLIPAIVLPMGITSTGGDATGILNAPSSALGVCMQAFASNSGAVQSSQGLLMNITF